MLYALNAPVIRSRARTADAIPHFVLASAEEKREGGSSLSPQFQIDTTLLIGTRSIPTILRLFHWLQNCEVEYFFPVIEEIHRGSSIYCHTIMYIAVQDGIVDRFDRDNYLISRLKTI